MAICEVVIQGVDGAGSKSPLRHAWAYWKEKGKLQLLRSDGAGRLFSLAPNLNIDRSHWWEYLDRFTTTQDADVEVCISRGAKPVPDALLPAVAFVKRKAALPAAAAAPTAQVLANAANKLVPTPTAIVELDEVPVTLADPAELTFWPLTWALHADDYPTAGLAQGSALFSGTGTSTAPNFPTAIDPPADKVPRERSLRIAGTIDSRVTALTFKITDGAGKVLGMKDAAGSAAAQIAATLGGGKFSADLFINAPGAAFGPVLVVGEISAAGKSFVEAFAGHLCGLQVGLVDDFDNNADGTQRGPVPNEQLRVDFPKTDPPPPETLDKARARRMVVYQVPERSRSAGAAKKPQMPLWMAEMQLVGVKQAELQDLLTHAYAKVNKGLSNPFAPATLVLELTWKAGLLRSGLNTEILAADLKQKVELNFNQAGQLTDASGQNPKVPLPAELREAFTTPPKVMPFPVSSRRLPTVLLAGAQRPWLPWPRHAGAKPADLKDALVVEFQPKLLTFTNKEAVRTDEGLLELTSLTIGFGDKTDPKEVPKPRPVPVGAPPDGTASGAQDPLVRLPPFHAGAVSADKVKSSSIFVAGKPFHRWFNDDFRTGKPITVDKNFNATVNSEVQFRKVWDSLTPLTGHAELTLNEWIAFFAIIYNETGGGFKPVPEGGTDSYFFNQLLKNPPTVPRDKASYNGLLGNRLAGNQLSAANPPLWTAPLLTDAADTAVWNQVNDATTNLGAARPASVNPPRPAGRHLVLYPGPGVWTGGSLSEAEKNHVRATAHECDFAKYRGRGLNQLTGRENYRQHLEAALAEAGFHADFAAHGKDRPSDLMTSADLDAAVLNTPHVYNTGFRSFHSNQLGQLAKVNQTPPVFFDVGAATGGSDDYGHLFEWRCQTLRTEMDAAGVILL